MHTCIVRAIFVQLLSDKRAAAKLCRSFSASNSLSLKILPLTPLDPRFWQGSLMAGPRNPNKSKILPISQEKKLRDALRSLVPVQRPSAPSWFIFTSQ